MSQPKLPVFKTVVAAYRGGVSALVQMPILLACAAVMVVGAAVLSVDLFGISPRPSDVLLQWLIGLAKNFLLLPLCIAVHRFVLLGQRETGYQPFRRKNLTYLAVLTVLFLPGMLARLFQYEKGGDPAQLFASLGVTALGVLCVGVLVKIAMIFPMIALGERLEGFGSIWGKTRGLFWRLVGALILASLPFAPVFTVSAYLGNQGLLYAAVILTSLTNVFSAAILCALLSEAYKVVAARSEAS